MFNQTTTLLKDRLNFDAILTHPRPTGRRSMMSNLFVDAKVLASAEDEGYEGTLGYIYEFSDGEVAIVSDHFTKGISYDTYEGVPDSEVRNILTELVGSAKVFSGVKDAFLYLRKTKQDNATYYELRDLVDPLIKNLYKNKAINLHEILGEV